MEALKLSLPLVSGLIGLTVAAEVRPAREAQGPPARPRAYYLTQTQHNGAEALSACAQGYHMASLWEIFDPSNVRYNTELGLTQDDSGSGPPTFVYGWIRTGFTAGVGGFAGEANCNVWTSDDGLSDSGTAVLLEPNWSLGGTSAEPVSITSPWVAAPTGCVADRSVWCVQD
jgi:hypothetical protein